MIWIRQCVMLGQNLNLLCVQSSAAVAWRKAKDEEKSLWDTEPGRDKGNLMYGVYPCGEVFLRPLGADRWP